MQPHGRSAAVVLPEAVRGRPERASGGDPQAPQQPLPPMQNGQPQPPEPTPPKKKNLLQKLFGGGNKPATPAAAPQ